MSHRPTTLRMAAAGLCAGLAAVAAEVSFHCPYDGDIRAVHSTGPGFGVCKSADFVPGKSGLALDQHAAAAPLSYVAPGNLDKARGSIELWVRPHWPANDTAWRTLVCEDGATESGSNAIWLWLYQGVLRFDVRDPADRYITCPTADWPRGEWRHIVATWDCGSGLALYVDGTLVQATETTWKPRDRARFFVGAGGRSEEPSLAALDELRLYSGALTAAEVRQACEGTLERTLRPSPPSPPAAVAAARPAKLLFHLAFDTSFAAGTAAGEATPRECANVALVDGLKGQAAHFPEDAVLRFGAAGNLVKEQGTIMLWYRPDWSGDEGTDADGREIWRCLFQEGPRPESRTGSSLLWLWFWRNRLRFDVSDAEDRYLLRPVAGWRAGQWHHIAVTWDCRRFRCLYVDGERVRAGRDSRKMFLPVEWDVADFEHFFVGSDGGSRPAAGSVDDFRIYDGPLRDADVRADFASVYPVRVAAEHRYFVVGRPASLRWRVEALGTVPVAGHLTWRFLDPRGGLVGGGAPELTLAPGGTRTVTAPFTPSAPGPYTLTCRWEAPGGSPGSESSLTFWGIGPEGPRDPGGVLDLTLIESIDCGEDLPADRLVDTGDSRIVSSPAGRYREAGPSRRSRFAVRFRVPDVGVPYVVDWEYPDDGERTMELIAQTVQGGSQQYELQTGAFCGAEYPLTHGMLTQRSVFWPRGEDLALIFMTAEEGRPAAAARVRIQRVNGRLPKLPVAAAAPVNGRTRSVGLYYEDPALCYDFGGYDTMPDFEMTVSRLLDIMEFSGQNLLMYPCVWYHGPFYPSRSQGQALQRTHPENFIEYLLLRFEQRGAEFIPTFNVHGLPSLSDIVWHPDQLLTGAAAAGPLMMQWDGLPNLSGWHGTPPNVNPLHPEVQNALLAMVDELIELYGGSPACKGLSFHLTRHCILWFGDLDAGYNDCCVEAFERETGIRVPVDPSSPGRVNARYRWLLANAREAWIDWRCRALRDLYGRIADRMRATRPDWRLILTLYRPNKEDLVREAVDLDAEPDYVGRINRESGMDPSLYEDAPTIVIQRTIYPADYRWYRAHRRYREDPLGIRRLNLDGATYRISRSAPENWLNMHDRYWEDDVGRRQKWDAFWGQECGWRVSTLNPNRNHALETYAAPLAQADFHAITKGGFLLGTLGIEGQVGAFSQAFRALPARPFQELCRVGTVTVRALAEDGGLYVYLVNAAAEAAVVTLAADRVPTACRDLATGAALVFPDARRLRFEVPGYGLRACRIDGNDMVLRPAE
ncbi:MAG: hypothetical protein JXR77_12030 [Lentisphaeria bacterium]|nr:hypothetical protein [Lentisphaeria bacterium]